MCILSDDMYLMQTLYTNAIFAVVYKVEFNVIHLEVVQLDKMDVLSSVRFVRSIPL